ncbi:MAG: TMEM165/GDT1 family protein [Deltaproteobacteria bacterium]
MLTAKRRIVLLRNLLTKFDHRLFLYSLGVVFLSEMGDKTQVTTMLLAGQKPLYILWVALGSLAALICTSFLEVIIGANILARWIKPDVIRFISAGVFILLGIMLLTGVIGQVDPGR